MIKREEADKTMTALERALMKLGFKEFDLWYYDVDGIEKSKLSYRKYCGIMELDVSLNETKTKIQSINYINYEMGRFCDIYEDGLVEKLNYIVNLIRKLESLVAVVKC